MNGKRIIQFVKTFEGALWAVQQVSRLVKLGWEVHVAAPSLDGRYASEWRNSGATLHSINCEFPVFKPWLLPSLKSDITNFIQELSPDIVHSHFVSTTLMLRYVLKDEKIPLVFQVPGPLHLEHQVFGQWETMWAGKNDYWIASSEFIRSLYLRRYSIPAERVYKSYYGTEINNPDNRVEGNLRRKYNIPSDAKLIGNVSFIYPPKHFLGQKTGLKGHELMIDALAIVMKNRPEVWPVFIGSQWGNSQAYFQKIKDYAATKSSRFIFTGYLPQKEIVSIWKEFELALHLPLSENCGGVIEPMLNQIPTIASNVGGLPEVIIHGKTGFLTERSVDEIVKAINLALDDGDATRKIARKGKELVTTMFDVNRTSEEVSNIYDHILNRTTKRPQFDSRTFIG
jgi:glycosyltransferase involved in cell wall biosynthesis